MLILVGIGLWLHEDRPGTGETGSEADALARRIEAATGQEAWRAAPVVQWTFAGDHHYLWDRTQHRVRVRWDDKEVLLSEWSAEGVAFDGERRLSGAEA